MSHVNQMLKKWTRAHGNPPFWIVEKDYALSYLLASIANTALLHNALVLKGGTALKKAYFASGYRFPFVAGCPSAEIVLETLPSLVSVLLG